MPAHLIHDVDAIGIFSDYFRRASTFTLSVPDPASAPRMPDDEFPVAYCSDGKVPVLVIKQVALDQQQRPIECQHQLLS